MLQKVLLAIYILAVLALSATAGTDQDKALSSSAVLDKN